MHWLNFYLEQKEKNVRNFRAFTILRCTELTGVQRPLVKNVQEK